MSNCMRLSQLVIVLLTVIAICNNVLADTWCYTNHPNAVFCDDFDRYCLDPPPWPQECSAGSTPAGGMMDNVWRYGGNPGNLPCSIMLPDTDFYTSSPFAGKCPNQNKGLLTHAQVELKTYCRLAFGDEYLAIMGTDQQPLILEFVLDGQTLNKIRYANNYMELSFGTASPWSTDFVWSPNCSLGCPGADERYPIICQQESPPADCPPFSGAPHLASIAVGALAYLDNNPCHCTDSDIHSPHNTHLSFFDGYKWWILREGLFSGSGDFQLRNRGNYIRLTIMSSTVKVELTCTDPNPDEYSWCIVPRDDYLWQFDYHGQFNILAAGYMAPCRLKAGVWECRDGPACIDGAPNGGVPRYDNVALYGGKGYVTPGACCFADTSCILSYGAADCEPYGRQYKGNGTDCATSACCPPFLPDHDMDTDVDLEDFGWFQACLSGLGAPPPSVPCECADLSQDGHVAQDDVTTFLGCLTGAGIPHDPGCMP